MKILKFDQFVSLFHNIHRMYRYTWMNKNENISPKLEF